MKLLNKNINRIILLLFLSVTPIIFFLIRLVSFKIIIKFGILNASRIGNLAAVSELYLCEKKLIKKSNKKIIHLIAIQKPVCNDFLLKIIKRKIIFFPYYFVKSNIIFISLINKLIKFGNKHLIYNNGHLTQSKDRDTKNLFSLYPNQINLNNLEINKAKKILSKINVNDNDKIVCLIVRDDAYLKNELSINKNNYDWSYHNYRDCNIENYKEACEYLVNKGFKVFRMGKLVNKKISFSNKNIIDYPFSEIKSDFMDVYLAYKCIFCISSGLGYDALPAIFRKPIVYTNITPIGCLWTWSNKYLAILKHLIFEKNNVKLTTSQHFKLDVDRADSSKIFKDKNIQIVENTNQDILDVVKEMVYLVDKEFSNVSISQINSLKFWEIYKQNIYDKYKSYDFYGNIDSNLSANFTKKYPNYLN